jgi:hypothetical protein
MPNDPLGDAAGAITARGAHRGDAVDELDLADRRHFRRAVLAVHRSALEKDRGDDIVPTAYVGQELRQQIAPALRRVPEMVMRIDDRQIGLQRRLAGPLREPRSELGLVAVGKAAIFALCVADLSHRIPPYPPCTSRGSRTSVCVWRDQRCWRSPSARRPPVGPDEVIVAARHASDSPTTAGPRAPSSIAGVMGPSCAAKLSTGGGTWPRRHICKAYMLNLPASTHLSDFIKDAPELRLRHEVVGSIRVSEGKRRVAAPAARQSLGQTSNGWPWYRGDPQ